MPTTVIQLSQNAKGKGLFPLQKDPEITKLDIYISISGHDTVHSFSTFSTSAMEAKRSTSDVQVQTGGSGHCIFIYKVFSREHGRDAIAIKVQLWEQ